MGVFKQLGEYLYLRKRDPDAPRTTWIRYMHGINRISLLLFLFGLIVFFVKLFLKKG